MTGRGRGGNHAPGTRRSGVGVFARAAAAAAGGLAVRLLAGTGAPVADRDDGCGPGRVHGGHRDTRPEPMQARHVSVRRWYLRVFGFQTSARVVPEPPHRPQLTVWAAGAFTCGPRRCRGSGSRCPASGGSTGCGPHPIRRSRNRSRTGPQPRPTPHGSMCRDASG